MNRFRRRGRITAISPNDVPMTGVVAPEPTAAGLPIGLRPIREGDQNYPTGNDLPHTHDLAAEELQERKKLGVQRYGQPLQPANGRDAVRDAYEEALDCAAYTAQVEYEQEHPEHTYVGWLVTQLFDAHKRASGDPRYRGESLMYPHGMFIPDGVRDYLDSLGYGLFELDPEDS